MRFLAALFVGRPVIILAVAALWLLAFLVRRSAAPVSARPLLAAAIGWAAYAAWEWLVTARTPEANIRVDLLVIWPVLAVLSAWALFRAFR